MKAFSFKIWIVAPLVVWSYFAGASNYNFLKNSVISEYTESDIVMLLEHVQIGLNENRAVGWHNTETGNGGTIAPAEPATYKDMRCRYAIITNKSKTKQGATRFRFCKMKDGAWRVVSGE